MAQARGSRCPGRWIALGTVAALATGLVWAWQAGALSSPAAPGAGQGAPAPATAAVTRQDVEAVEPLTATLGYAGSYRVTGRGGGTLTWLPVPGQVIRQGEAAYRVDNASPVVLLYGSVPDWRALGEGVSGQDVSQLNHDLVTLGYARSADIAALGWDNFSAATASGVQRLETRLGVSSPSGRLALGQVLFEPGALRVTQVTGTLGGAANVQVMLATSDQHVVNIPLDASDQSQVVAGDKVTVTLPNGATTPGVVSSVGTVATSAPGANGNPTTVIPVVVTLNDPGAAGSLDQAPVTVNVTTASAHDVLAVPVGALLAQASGGYDVEVVGPGNTRSYVPVTPGIFDDANGLVQVSGALTPGQSVVVAAS